MKQAKFLLLMLCALLGYTNVLAETVSPYTMDFDTNPGTSNHDFAVSSNWGHIVGFYHDSWADGYMSYSYSSSDGIGGSGTLLAYKQYAQNMYGDGSVVKDILVTPKVSGTITMYVKTSLSATASYPSMVEIYDVDDAGTTLGEVIKKFTPDDGFVADDTYEGWYTISLNLDSEKRLGIRAQYVYLDNFSATSATIVPEKKLTIKSVADVDGASTTYFNQQADGTILARYLITLTNSGDIDLNPGDENYTLSLFDRNYPSTLYGAFEIPVTLAAGETSEPFIMEISLPAAQKGWKYWDVKENISGTTSQGKSCGTNEYASKFIFDKSGTSSSSATRTPIDFGKATEDVTLNYEIYNAGSAPLVINSFTLSAPFTSDAPTGEFTVEGGEKKQIAITLPATEAGVFSGQLEIAYTNFGKEQATYTLGISGTIIDPSKNWITFDNGSNGAYPAGSIHSDQVYISKQTVNNVDNYYLQSTSTTTKFITPLLTAEAGESFTFDVWYSSYSSTAAVLVYTSTDRVNWTQVANVTSSDINESVKTITVTIDKAGDYYIAFELKGNALIDNIYGLTLAETPEHDWYITEEATIPAKGKQNNDYTATIKVQNISDVADIIQEATLYVGGEPVKVITNIELPGNDKTAAVGTGRKEYSNIDDPTVINLTFKPHKTGTLPVYIELKSGDTVIKSETVNVTFEEEKAESELATESNGASSSALLNLNWNNSESVNLYSAETLAAMGLKDGDKINKITFKGYREATEYTTTLNVWYEFTDDQTQTSPSAGVYSTDGMINALSETHTWKKEGSSNELADMIVVNFSEPLVYEEGKSLRIVVRSEATAYKQAYFEQSKISGAGTSYYHRNDTPSYFLTENWSASSYLPAIHLGLIVETPQLTGTVTDEETNEPIEGVKVTISTADDIQYSGTTDENGEYAIDIVQKDLTYNSILFDKTGYEPLLLSEEMTFTEGGVDKSVALTPLETVEVTISSSTYATLYYENKEFEIPERVEAYTVTKDGNIIYMNQLTGHIPAGTPVVLHAEPGTYQLTTTDITPTTEIESDLVGSEEGGKYEESGYKYYILSWRSAEENVDEVGFYFQSGSAGKWAEVRAHQAFLRVPDDNASAAGYRLSFEEPTGIDSAKLAEANNSDAIYSISGARVNKGNLQKGIYIMNGKKVVIK